MTSPSVAIFRPRARVRPLSPAQARERWLERRVELIWGLLVMNVLTFVPGGSVIPIPSAVGKGITQAALQAALLLALSINRRLVFRPSLFLCLVSLLALEAVLTSINAEYAGVGTTYRTVRFIEFAAVLWLLSPYWGRRDLLLVRCHLKIMMIVLGTVVLGLFVDPGLAMTAGRLGGALWPIPPTQVAHYAAVTLGMVTVLWFSGLRRGKAALSVAAVAAVILVLTHTRTALVGLVAGLVVAGLSVVTVNPRVRKMFAVAGVVVLVALATLSSVLTSWLARGEGTQQLTSLTGRTNFWAALLTFPRDKFQEIFGFGLSNDSFNGLPIDSNWLASYQDQGIFGIVVCAVILLVLVVAAFGESRAVQRALALFIVTYCLVASFTEVGFTNASPYLLDITLAASLLVPPVTRPSDLNVRAGAPGTPG